MSDKFFEDVEMIKIKTGELFETEEEAGAYIIDKVCEEINEILKPVEFASLRYSDLIKLITTLCGDLGKIKKLHSILNTYVN